MRAVGTSAIALSSRQHGEPGNKLATVDDLLAIPEERRRHALIDGELVEREAASGNPLDQTLMVHRWNAFGYIDVLSADASERVRAEPFDAIDFVVGSLFRGARRRLTARRLVSTSSCADSRRRLTSTPSCDIRRSPVKTPLQHVARAGGPKARAWHTPPVDRRDPIEERAAAIHERVAARIRREPELLVEAVARLSRRLEQEGGPADPVLCEWRDVLLMLTPEQVAAFVESDTPRARRLRISSPLVWLAR